MLAPEVSYLQLDRACCTGGRSRRRKERSDYFVNFSHGRSTLPPPNNLTQNGPEHNSKK
jgi:hypothetical protein